MRLTRARHRPTRAPQECRAQEKEPIARRHRMVPLHLSQNVALEAFGRYGRALVEWQRLLRETFIDLLKQELQQA